MKCLMIKSATSTELGECVLPTTPKPCRGCYEEVEVWKYDLKKWEENNASLPKLDTTCTLPAGEWFEGKRKTKYHYRGEWHNDIYGPQDEMDWADNGAKSQTFIVPVEQKDEPSKSGAIKELRELSGGHWDKFNSNEAIIDETKGKDEPKDDGILIHPDSQELLLSFFRALAEKMIANEKKYGWSNEWATEDWEQECRENMMKHIEKGDPKDVAIYAAFMWKRGWSTQTPPKVEAGNKDTKKNP